MAVIQKIRTKYAKVAGFIIALALVGFILMDAASGKFGELFGRDASVAKVNGEKIDQVEFSKRVKDYELLYAYSSKGKPIDDQTRAQINDQSLRELINDILVKTETEKIGLQTTQEEEKELIYGAVPDPIVQQYPVFTNPETKMFDPQRVKAFEQQVDQMDPTGKAKEEWEAVKAYVLRNNTAKKYVALVSSCSYTPKFVLDMQTQEQKDMADIRFVKVPFATINDAEVKVTDEELNAYMKKKAPLYTLDEPTRSIEYVSFDVTPSTDDTAKSKGTLEKIKADFVSTTDNESFVNRNSDEQYTDMFVSKKSYMSAYADSILNAPVGTVVGPYMENGVYKLTKVLERRTLPDSVKVRHILIKTENAGQPIVADSIGKMKIDSVQAAIAGGADFGGMVQAVSEDEGSKQTGGEYTFTIQDKTRLSKEFSDFIFDGKAGEKKVVKVDNDNYAGYHYIEILSQAGMESAAKLATVSKALFAGDNTEAVVYAKATEFAGKNGNEKAFDEAVKKQNLNKRVAENVKANDFVLPGLGSAREVIRWMYEAKVGDVSPVFSMDGHYVVAKMNGKQDAGLMKLDASNRPSIEAAVRGEKKGTMIAAKYKSAQNLESVAQMSGQQVQVSDSVNAASGFIPNMGYDPKAIGYAFYKGFNLNTMSPAITGQDGVTYMTVVNRHQRAIMESPEMAQRQAMMMQMQTRQAIGGGMFESLKKAANIQYNPKNL
ncbi:MAG: hypothetical protein EOP51_08630 [Sphingobacteriales bacterium]|nr:MAG: hypothetical protein EOP51_08630 [Sphingobacteriales bacterium]